MNTEEKLFQTAYTQAKSEQRRHATLIRTEPIRDPLETYRSIAGYVHDAICIMESATHDGTKGRFSYIGVSGTRYLTLNEKRHLDWLKEMLRRDCPPSHPVLPFIGGAVGFFSHELITLIETTVPTHSVDPFRLPLGEVYFYSRVIVFDHEEKKMHFVVNVDVSDKGSASAYREGCKGMVELQRMSEGSAPPMRIPLIGPVGSNMSKEEYLNMVLRAKEYIASGDVLQVVLSQRFQTSYENDASGLTLYAKLRELNPSPYMFHMDCRSATERIAFLGASPEIAVHIERNTMRIRPIAGTRKRGATPEEDKRLAEELQTDPKELAEHRMLVDLARNDVGRFCKANSIAIPELMEVEPYSHVMHLTSEVAGELREGVHPLDAALGVLPPGTLSGAPKIRALQLIAELEKSRRGPYGGAFGWMTDQALDTCIFIRSALLHKEKLYWQSGDGIVADSTPEGEYQETLDKARAIETALNKIGKHWTSHEK